MPDFIFCLHNHQPVGNFEHILECAFKDSYNKTIQILKEYPEFRFAVHHSGPLLEWIKEHRPEYLHLMKDMAERGQMEIIGGGFYEPIFSIISHADITGQIKLMQEFCKKEFGITPEGFWTAERVWDPEIPSLVSDFDLKFTILDDIHFRYAGIEENDLLGYYITERLDKNLIIFPIDKFLRYSIPFKQPGETIEYFRKKSDINGSAAFVYGDDGEKFGLWPETHKLVFEEKWLRNFIEAILKEKWIRTVLPSEHIKKNPPKGRVYLTQGSYFELSEWALPSASALKLININNEIKGWKRENDFYPFLKGGIWNNFLNKYPESNAINKRSILLSREIDDYEREFNADCREEKKELYRGECNCAYWHGLFGGIYLNNLRHALYRHILMAEKLLLERKGNSIMSIVQKDYWNEGKEQILIRNRNQSVIIVPHLGGAVSEFGIYNKSFNIFNLLSRKFEAYHEVLKNYNDDAQHNNGNNEVKSIHDRIVVKEPGLKKYLVYDKNRRYSFKDIFFKEIPSPEDIMLNKADIFECAGLDYYYDIIRDSSRITTALSRTLEFRNEKITIAKAFTINDDSTGISADYKISGGSGYFGIELNINLLGGHDADRYYEIPGAQGKELFLDTSGLYKDIKSFSLTDRFSGFKIYINTSEATLITYPVYTVSQSDAGFEKNFQGSCIILVYKIHQNPMEANLSIQIK